MEFATAYFVTSTPTFFSKVTVITLDPAYPQTNWCVWEYTMTFPSKLQIPHSYTGYTPLLYKSETSIVAEALVRTFGNLYETFLKYNTRVAGFLPLESSNPPRVMICSKRKFYDVILTTGHEE